MNFKRFKETTQFHVKEGAKADHSLSRIVAMERCKAVKEFLDDSYNAILSDEEREFIDTTIRVGMRQMFTDVLLHATENPEGFNEMISKVLGLDTDEFGGEIDD